MPRSTVLPVDAARWALWTFVAVNVVTVEVLFISAGTGKNGVLTTAKFFGLHAALLMLFQLLLVARLPWLDRRIGMDRLTVWHRWVGFTLLWTVLTHATLVVLGFATLDDASMAKTFLALAGVPASLLGMLAAGVIVVIAAVSTRPLRRRLPYEVWHGLHLMLYVALGLSFVHQLMETTTFTSSAFARVYWWALWLFAFGALLAGRIVVPVWRNAYHGFRVAAVTPESDNVVSVHVTGRHLDKLPAQAGQFFIWRFPGHNHWWSANPFSLSAAPNGRGLRLTAKAVGSASTGLRHLPVGTRAYLEGPYGAFTSLHRTRPGVLLIAGGVGITPVRALLEEESAGDVVVLYRARSERDAVLVDEVRALAAARGGRLHLLTGRTGQYEVRQDPS
ncbi:ferric reductase-like transmembrane domain-containing protein [Streptomyces sp. NPDC002688]|uniref:ferredoxin reductase family protein n=1 Tax=Streptomyces sp. NPDC002688 TaxID=3154423 RepID=UPI00332697E9